MTTIAEALRDAARRLAPVSDTARLDAELLMADVLRVTRSDLLLRHGGADAAEHLAAFEALVTRRQAHEPIAYVLGHQEFYGRTFQLAPGVLIPRGDSETVVEAALDAAPGAPRVLDCGTGSGALLLTVLAERPAAEGIGIDASAQAAQVAAANVEALGLNGRAQILRRDWTQAGWADDLGRFDLVIANPPYVEADAALAPSVRDWEPPEALFAGPEGLDDYRILVPQLRALLAENGFAVLEIGATQAESVEEIATAAGFATTLHRDLAGRPRAMVLQ